MITMKMVLGQLKRDLIGKDVYRGTTQTYTLLANQFGHFALGFMPTSVIYSIIQNATDQRDILHWPWVSVSLFWTLFEVLHYQHAVVGHRKRAVRCEETRHGHFPFRPAWGNIRRDTMTDIGFFCAGALLAGYLFLHTPLLLLAFGALYLPLLALFFYWYKTKMYLQEANFPFHYRLSQWVLHINQQNADTVQRFLNGPAVGNHLLVLGDDVEEKASLCVGIATELAFRQRSCQYLTAMKLLPLFGQQDPDSHHSLEQQSLWNWRESSVLIIDDINPAQPVGHEGLTAADFFHHLNHEQFAGLNKKALCTKNVIWVLGSRRAHREQAEWQGMLEGIGIEPAHIATVYL
jgi:hypothetical protein